MMAIVSIALRAVLFAFNAAVLLLAAGGDMMRRVIYDKISLLLLAGGVTARLLLEPKGIWLSAIVALVVYAILAAMTAIALIGGGDAKLAAAATFLVPANEVPVLFLDISLAGGLLGIAYVIAKWARLTRETTLPYGVAISGGVLYRMVVDQCLH